MKLLVAVKSCLPDCDRGLHKAIEESWALGFKGRADVKFFTGRDDRQRQPNHIMLKCGDSYNELPDKTMKICQWMLGKVYDSVLLADTDTALYPSKVLALPFSQYDYIGKIDRPLGQTFDYTAITREGEVEFHPNCFGWCSGGFGYALSRKAATIVADMVPKSYAEDLSVGQVLGPGIASGELNALHVNAGVYSSHHPNHGEIYDPKILIDWLNQQYKEHP